MTNTLNQTPTTETILPTAVLSAGAPGSTTCLRETVDGTRTLCLTPMRNEARLGEPVSADPFLGQVLAPLVARFAALVFNEHDAMIEPLLQQLRWMAYEHGIDHVVLPLWPEAQLAQRLTAIAIDLGMPANFILTQDEASWPGGAAFSGGEIGDYEIGALYA